MFSMKKIYSLLHFPRISGDGKNVLQLCHQFCLISSGKTKFSMASCTLIYHNACKWPIQKNPSIELTRSLLLFLPDHYCLGLGKATQTATVQQQTPGQRFPIEVPSSFGRITAHRLNQSRRSSQAGHSQTGWGRCNQQKTDPTPRILKQTSTPRCSGSPTSCR